MVQMGGKHTKIMYSWGVKIRNTSEAELRPQNTACLYTDRGPISSYIRGSTRDDIGTFMGEPCNGVYIRMSFFFS